MTDPTPRLLAFAVRPRVVLRHVGDLLVAVGLLTLVPALVGLGFGELAPAGTIAAAAAAFLAAGALLRRVEAPGDVRSLEAAAVTVVVFLVTPLVQSFALPAGGVPWIDALFETVSGITTTGLSTLGSVEERARSFLFLRAWMQWYGGLGIVVLTLALIMGPGVAARRFVGKEDAAADFMGSARRYAAGVVRVYVVLTVLGVLLLLACGHAPFSAVVHTLAAVSTGGFSPADGSLASLDGALPRFGVIGLTLLGALPLVLYERARRRGWRALLGEPEPRALLGSMMVLGAATTIVLWREDPSRGLAAAAEHGVLTAFSAHGTSGFSSLPVAELGGLGMLLLTVAMLTGGCVGSTAGGVKVMRLLIAAKVAAWVTGRARLPSHAVNDPRLAGARIRFGELARALTVFQLFLVTIVLSWLAFVAAGYDVRDALFEVVSATGTVGLSTGIARPELEPWLKGVLCVDMFLGRLEVMAVLIVLDPRCWLGRRPG